MRIWEYIYVLHFTKLVQNSYQIRHYRKKSFRDFQRRTICWSSWNVLITKKQVNIKETLAQIIINSNSKIIDYKPYIWSSSLVAINMSNNCIRVSTKSTQVIFVRREKWKILYNKLLCKMKTNQKLHKAVAPWISTCLTWRGCIQVMLWLTADHSL